MKHLGFGLMALACLSTYGAIKFLSHLHRRDLHDHEQPLLDLKQKYARGEITREEYLQNQKNLLDQKSESDP